MWIRKIKMYAIGRLTDELNAACAKTVVSHQRWNLDGGCDSALKETKVSFTYWTGLRIFLNAAELKNATVILDKYKIVYDRSSHYRD